MAANPLRRLHALGQSIWLDYVRRGLIASGELARLMADDAVTGVTSNPSIFEKAIDESDDYDAAIAGASPDLAVRALYDELTLADIRAAADALRPAYDGSGGRDGFVSIEVAPELADDTEGSIAEATRLWRALQRPNVMIKIPATPAGCPAVRRLIADGINVNITLMFSLEHYDAVAEAYLSGLEQRAARGLPLSGVASVASFFVSRVDTKLDADPRLPAELRGKVAVANARAAYARFRATFAGPRWEALARRGAALQRPLWASTSTKNPAYSDVLYVDELAGPDTVNTMPPQTLEAYRQHGRPADRLGQDPTGVLQALPGLGIDLGEVGRQLQREGVKAFADSYAKVLASIEKKRRALVGGRHDG
jgi:transaldolase